MNDIRLFSYKMTDDTGFAPNPFYGLLTLANCKPDIRKTKDKDDWIAGFTSKELNGDNVGEEKLIFLMKVTDKITYEKYWSDPLYKCKRPNLSSLKMIDQVGDNIYQPIKLNAKSNTDFQQIANKYHDENCKNYDLDGEYVLISEYFYYFGSCPEEILRTIRPSIPKKSTRYGVRTHIVEKASNFIECIQKKYKDKINSVISDPHGFLAENIKNQKCNKKC
jgi:hypothetical protein